MLRAIKIATHVILQRQVARHGKRTYVILQRQVARRGKHTYVMVHVARHGNVSHTEEEEEEEKEEEKGREAGEGGGRNGGEEERWMPRRRPPIGLKTSQKPFS